MKTKWVLIIDGKSETTTREFQSFVLGIKGRKAKEQGKKVKFYRIDWIKRQTNCL